MSHIKTTINQNISYDLHKLQPVHDTEGRNSKRSIIGPTTKLGITPVILRHFRVRTRLFAIFPSRNIRPSDRLERATHPTRSWRKKDPGIPICAHLSQNSLYPKLGLYAHICSQLYTSIGRFYQLLLCPFIVPAPNTGLANTRLFPAAPRFFPRVFPTANDCFVFPSCARHIPASRIPACCTTILPTNLPYGQHTVHVGARPRSCVYTTLSCCDISPHNFSNLYLVSAARKKSRIV